jgi:hypothetical protein
MLGGVGRMTPALPGEGGSVSVMKSHGNTSRWTLIVVLLSVFAIVWTPGTTRISQAGPGYLLGEAPVALFAGGQQGTANSGAARSVGVDTSSRSAVADYYFSQYVVTEPELGPTGSITTNGGTTTCTPGLTTASYKAAVLQRINYYRGMAGVPQAPNIDAVASAKEQQAAIMYVANGALSHNPPSTWTCYTADAATAAPKSNISIGANGWNAIDLYMKDKGASNNSVGHRRWVLYPQTQSFGTGDVQSSGGANSNYGGKSNALWVQDGNIWASRPATVTSPGLLPVTFPTRWSSPAGRSPSRTPISRARR